MKYSHLIPVIALALTASAALAESTKGHPPGEHPMMPKTRQEAIEFTKKRLSELEKMSDKEWEERREHRKGMHEKMKDMPPEKREKMREMMKERREGKGHEEHAE